MKEQMAKSSTSRSDPQGMFFLYLGTVLAQKTGFPFSYQKKKLLVIHTTENEWLTWELFTCPVDVCKCVNVPEAQRKGNKRITEKIFNVFHQSAWPKCPFLSEGKPLQERVLLSSVPEGNHQHSGSPSP